MAIKDDKLWQEGFDRGKLGLDVVIKERDSLRLEITSGKEAEETLLAANEKLLDEKLVATESIKNIEEARDTAIDEKVAIIEEKTELQVACDAVEADKVDIAKAMEGQVTKASDLRTALENFLIYIESLSLAPEIIDSIVTEMKNILAKYPLE